MAILVTDRLRIDMAKVSDAQFFLELLTSPTWLRYIGDRNVHSVPDAEKYINNTLIKSYRENGFGLYKVSLVSETTPIGVCGFFKRDYLDSVDIGYALLPGFEGKGYMLEAARAVLAYGVTKLGFTVIYGMTDPDNVRSSKVLEKIGLKRVGSLHPDEFDKPLDLYEFNAPEN